MRAAVRCRQEARVDDRRLQWRLAWPATAESAERRDRLTDGEGGGIGVPHDGEDAMAVDLHDREHARAVEAGR